MMRGVPVTNGQYAGSPFSWVHPFAILTGIGLVLGYALLGAGWLVLKSEGAVRDWAYRRVGWLAAAALIVLALAFTVTFDYSALARSDLQTRRWGLAFPLLGLLSLGALAVGVHRKRHEAVPFAMTVIFFVAAFLSLGVMFWPYIIPYSLTVASAAAPDVSLRFLFYCGIIVLPVIVIYTIVVYWVFRGKVRSR